MAKPPVPELAPERMAVAEKIRNQIIPVISAHGLSRMVLGRPKMARAQLPPAVGLVPGAPLGRAARKRGRGLAVVKSWPSDRMEALRFPSVCFVIEGEADIRVGESIVQCPAGHGFVFPSGLARSAGHHAHWYRPEPESAHSEIVWVNVNSTGATCHRCQTRGTQHLSDYGWYSIIIDRTLLPLTENLVEEWERERTEYEVICNAYLTAIFHKVLQHMTEAPVPAEPGKLSPGYSEGGTGQAPDLVLSRAQDYIENHLTYRMTLEDIAHASYVSRAKLAQIFREQLGQTVWDYVTHRRLEEAKIMLANTDLYVYRIAFLIGFASPTRFSARFTEICGMSPGEYREQARQAAQETKA